jgi:integrase
MISKTLASGTAYFWQAQHRDRKAGCQPQSEALGNDFEAATARARMLNEQLDAWREGRNVPVEIAHAHKIGTVDWWHNQYLHHQAYTKLSPRTQKDYREVLEMVANVPTQIQDARTGEPKRVGSLMASSLSQQAVDKIYAKIRDGGRVNRQADLAMDVCRRAWKVVRRSNPGLFLVPVIGPDGKTQRLAINPFEQMERAEYERDTAKPATREQAQALAETLEAAGHPALAVGALICYEWLQRPEDVRKGRITWTDFRPAHKPRHVQIFHHKTGERVWQPLDHVVADPETGDEVVHQLYPELEAMIDRLPKLGVPLVMFEPKKGPKDASGKRTPRLYSEPYSQHLVQAARRDAKLPSHITLEACRHGGMTECGDAELTEQEIMSLSGHVTPAAARLYVKRTEKQRLQAAIKRRASVNSRTKSG